jgi:hypothetical protein
MCKGTLTHYVSRITHHEYYKFKMSPVSRVTVIHMISKFLLHQMDYIYFLYGLSLIFLSVVCYTLKREKKSDLPWLWLGLFGLTHGLSKWLEFLTIITGPRPIIEIIKLSLLISSYLFLLNFGRLAITSLKIWICLPLLCLSFTAYLLMNRRVLQFSEIFSRHTGRYTDFNNIIPEE